MSDQPPIPPHVPQVPVVIPYAQPAWVLPFKDRRTGLNVLGIVLIILGVLAGCTTLAMPFSLFAMSLVPGSTPGSRSALAAAVIGATAMYALAATGLIWLGIGSTRAHRYVRPIVLSLAWLAIAVTALSLVNTIGAMSLTRAITASTGAMPGPGPLQGNVDNAIPPATTRATAGTARTGVGTNSTGRIAPTTREGTTVDDIPVIDFSADGEPGGAVEAEPGRATAPARPGGVAPAAVPPAMPAGMIVGMIISMVFFALIGIGIAVLFIWFYSSEDTRQTMEFFDPRTRWTDGVPVRVLGVVIVLTMVVALCPFSLLQQWPGLAAGGSIIGSTVAAGAQVMAGLLALAAIKPVYRRTQAGWGMALAVLALLMAGAITAIHFSDPAAQLQTWGVFDGAAVRDALRDQQNWQIVTAILFGVGAAGYLFWVRRLFGSATVAPDRPHARL